VPTVIPRAVDRRLLLALLGYRCVDGLWVGPGPLVSEEAVDRMSPQAWGQWVRRWATSATRN
jgi:hypothetical protein